jgi:hypothetical protein
MDAFGCTTPSHSLAGKLHGRVRLHRTAVEVELLPACPAARMFLVAELRYAAASARLHHTVDVELSFGSNSGESTCCHRMRNEWIKHMNVPLQFFQQRRISFQNMTVIQDINRAISSE